MKICLINSNPAHEPSILDIGLAYLATYIQERTDHQAFIWDQTYHGKRWPAALVSRIEIEKPDLIGITCNTMHMAAIKDMVRFLKKRFRLPIILGGIHPTLMPEDSIAIPAVDAICIGEGEFVLAAYMDKLEQGVAPVDIAGLWIKNAGNINKTKPAIPVADLDSFPIPNYLLWDDIEKFCYLTSSFHFIGNRACKFNCSFCSNHALKKAVPGTLARYRTPEAFVEEIGHQYALFKDKGIRIAHIFDPVFTIDEPWLARFCDAYITSGLAERLPFSIYSRPDALDQKRIEMLAAANCSTIRMGIETGNEEFRKDIYHKAISNEAFRRTCKMAHESRLLVTGYNILGGPGETWNTMKDTYRFSKELKVDRPFFFFYRPFPKTRCFELVESANGPITKENIETVTDFHGGPVSGTADLSPVAISAFYWYCVLTTSVTRTVKLIRKQGLSFFGNFFTYLKFGLKNGLRFKFIVGYFLYESDENVHD
jgi:radical SAM superfamily enzyme YgiQ (UPF0313 family)